MRTKTIFTIAGLTVAMITNTFAQITAPNLIAPEDYATNVGVNVELSWTASENADFYEVEIANNVNFKGKMEVVKHSGLKKHTLEMDGLEEGKQYYWRVKAVNYSRRYKYSQIFMFETEVKVILPTFNYNDVLVLANINSQISKDVAGYFKSQRNIPEVNVCNIPMPTTEEITGNDYNAIISQIKVYMNQNNLTESINYIVTTQGVPLKVRRNTGVFSMQSDASSFDSDMILMNSDYEYLMGNKGPIFSPFFNSSTPFSRHSDFGNIYLVTRLAGYCFDDIKGLIDRAAQPYDASATIILDKDPGWGTSSLNYQMEDANSVLVSRGFNVLLDNTTTYITGYNNVLGYYSWGSNDKNHKTQSYKAQPNFTWSPKALAETYVSSSGRSFTDSNFVEPSIGWQSMVADLIKEGGVTGVKGYVFEPYSSAMSLAGVLFDMWTNGYNLAESYYGASAYLGWMDVVIGDPKSTLKGNGVINLEANKMTAGINQPNVKPEVSLYPNPASSVLNIASNSLIGSIQIMDMTGKIVADIQGVSEYYTQMNIGENKNGVYFVTIVTNNGASNHKIVINK